jgi:hypothetical protein
MSDLLFSTIDLLQATGIALLIYILPGWCLLQWGWRKTALDWGEQLGLAASLSLALWPVMMLWFYQFRLPMGRITVWAIAGLSLVLWLVWLRRQPGAWLRARPHLRWEHAPDFAYLVVILALVITRLLPIRTMLAPAWGDSVHHTLIVQLMLDNGGLFQSWEPYVALESFSYHFGFHASMAQWAWLSGMDAAQSVLIGAQMLNVLAVLALYPLAVRLAGGNRWAGVAAVLAAGLLFQMPAFYVNWGRYTQLGGQAILPGLFWTFDRWWTDQPRPSRRLLGLTVVLSAGLALTHYRMAVVAAAGGLAWGLWALWLQRQQLGQWLQRALWLIFAAGVSGLIILPWVLTIRSTRLPYVAGSMAQQGLNFEQAAGDLIAWGSVDLYYTRIGWLMALAALLVALVRRPQVGVILLLWGGFTFLLTNPYLLRLPGSGLVNNFTLVIGAYLPIALACGWLIGELALIGLRRVPMRLLGLVLFGLLVAYGTRQQLQIVDPAYQMVTPADQAALAWVKHHTPADAEFVVNGFLAYGDRVVVGSDAGWWLPYYTERQTTVPPIVYTVERFEEDVDREELRQLVLDLQASAGDEEQLEEILCRAGATHLYLGDRQERLSGEAAPLITTEWLTGNDDFQLLHQVEQAQVWAFERASCASP